MTRPHECETAKAPLPAVDHAFVRKVEDWSRRTGVTLVAREAIPEDDMSENSTGRDKRTDVDANVESASVVPQTSKMRIRRKTVMADAATVSYFRWP